MVREGRLRGELGARWAILLGALLGSIMWANVWFVIHPKQKIVIQNALDTAAGNRPIPPPRPPGARAGLASRTNTALSVPMLFFMGAASHLQGLGIPRSGLVFWIGALVIMALVEINALKGTPGRVRRSRSPPSPHTLWAGFILTAVFIRLVRDHAR